MLLPLSFCILSKIKQSQLKDQARERLEKYFLKKVTLTINQFTWTEPGKEISIDGNLFDVKYFSLKEDKFVFTGLFDKEETSLKKFDTNWQNNQQEKLLTELFQVLQSVFYNSKLETNFYQKAPRHYLILTPDRLSFLPKKIITPPPKAWTSNLSKKT